jgi:RNA polymerase sigma-70 factor (ECF subfamily)
MRLARAGSNEALGEMLEGCRQYLLLVANESLEPELVAKAGASDIVQETFVSAGRHFSGFSGTTESELLAWLRQILLNHLVSTRRRFFLSQKRRLSREVSFGGSGSRSIASDLMDARSESPSRHALMNERVNELQRAIDELPLQYRQIIQLRHRDQLPFDEVARQLHISAPAARQMWARAIKRLQRTL